MDLTEAADDRDRRADRSLIDDYRAGEKGAVTEVEGWIRAALFARYRVLRSEWGDLTQTVHAKLLANLEQGAFEHGSSFKTYVARIAHYTAIDLLRNNHRERTRPGPHDPAGGSSPYATLIRRERGELLHTALHLLSADCLMLWKMIFLEKRPYDQIAERLEVPLGTVKSRMWHCRKKLRAIVRRLENPEGPSGEN